MSAGRGPGGTDVEHFWGKRLDHFIRVWVVTMKTFLLVTVSALCSVMVAAFGCKDTSTQPQPTKQTFYDKSIQPIFTDNCSNLGCHPGGGAPFSLKSGESYANLVNVPATNGGCPGSTLRVKPGVPDSSVLSQRIEGECGLNQMPKGLPPMSQALIDSIVHWINRGASKDF